MGRFHWNDDDENENEDDSSTVHDLRPASNSLATTAAAVPLSESFWNASAHHYNYNDNYNNNNIINNHQGRTIPRVKKSNPSRFHLGFRPLLMTVRIIIMFLWIVILPYYAPPPPSPYDHWTQYVRTGSERFQVTVTHLVAVVSYLLHGSYRNFMADVRFYMQQRLPSSITSSITSNHQENNHASICQNIHHDPSDKNPKNDFHAQDMKQYLSQHIFGQDYAIQLLSQEMAQLFADIVNVHPMIDSSSSSSSSSFRNTPTSILLTGPTGVGKSSTIEWILFYLQQHYWYHLDHDHPDCRIKNPKEEFVLELNGIDYMIDPIQQQQPQHQHYDHPSQKSFDSIPFVNQILNHVQKHQERHVQLQQPQQSQPHFPIAIIVVKHVELLSKTHQMELVRLMQSSTLIFRKESSSSTTLEQNLFMGPKNPMMVVQDMEISLSKTLFLLTSDMGSKQIFEIIRRHHAWNRGGDHAWNSMMQLLRQDIQQQSHYFHLVDSIIPYGPLQYLHLKQILQHQINLHPTTPSGADSYAHPHGIILQRSSYHYEIELSDAAIQFLVGPKMVEYMEIFMEEDDSLMVNQGQQQDTASTSLPSSSSSSFVFAARGGHDISWRQIRKWVDHFVEQSSFYTEHEFIYMDVNIHRDIVLFQRCSRTQKNEIPNIRMNKDNMICYDRMEMNVNQIQMLSS